MRWQWWWPWINSGLRRRCCQHNRFERWLNPTWPWSGYTRVCWRRMIRWMRGKWWWPIIDISFFIFRNHIHIVRWLRWIFAAHAERLSSFFREEGACVILAEHPRIEDTKFGHFLQIWITTFDWFAAAVCGSWRNAYATFAQHVAPCCDRAQTFVTYGTCIALRARLLRRNCMKQMEKEKSRIKYLPNRADISLTMQHAACANPMQSGNVDEDDKSTIFISIEITAILAVPHALVRRGVVCSLPVIFLFLSFSFSVALHANTAHVPAWRPTI